MRNSRRTLCCAVILAATCGAAPATVPKPYRGAWARDGKCAVADMRLVLHDNTAQVGRTAPAAVVLTPNDSPEGLDALHWAEEGEVDNFVLRTDPDAIIHNTQGYGMGAMEIYRRCKR